jgi:Domain of unknown function (DUF5666)
MSERSFDEILDKCVDLLRAGASIEDCVATYPQHADGLRAQLNLVQDLLTAHTATRPDPSAVATGRGRLLGAVTARPTTAAPEPERAAVLATPVLLADRNFFGLLPKALPAVVAMLVLGGAAWGVSAATTGDASPGAWFGNNSHAERVEVRGTLSSIELGAITIATPLGPVTVVITGQTEFEDKDETPLTLVNFAVGDVVKVSAVREGAGGLVAREIAHDDEDQPVETPTEPADPPTVEPIAQPTANIQPTDEDDDENDGDDDDDGGGGGGGDSGDEDDGGGDDDDDDGSGDDDD